MPNPEMQLETDLAITDILHANAVQVLDNTDAESGAEVSANPANTNKPCCVHNCRVTTSGFITTENVHVEPTAKNAGQQSRAKTKRATAQFALHLPSDRETAHQITEAKEDFDNGTSIIGQSLKKDLLAIEEVESYLNQKEIFLDASKDCLRWQQDQAHDQTRFHFVLSGKREDRSQWLASDARYVRTRLAELVGNLAYELKILKTVE